MLGIDFGTSNSAAAIVLSDGSLCPIALDADQNAMPTALYFDGGPVRFGSAALQGYLNENDAGSGRLVRGLKSLLGSRLMNEQTLLQGRMTSFFDIVVLFLHEIRTRAEQQLGHAVEGVMLGRPVHFVDDDAARDALAQANLERDAHAAGFAQVRFHLEPVAAAFDYQRRIARDSTVLVVDIGGGTSDFSVMRLGQRRQPGQPGGAEVLATSGVHLGGTNFDQLLNLRCVMPLMGLGHLGARGREVPASVFFDLSTWHLIHQAYSRKQLHHAAELRSFYADPQLHQRLMLVLQQRQGHRLLALVEAAKISCSDSAAPAGIDLGSIEPALGAPLTPALLAETLALQVGKIANCARRCVAASGVGAPDLLYLAGGSSALVPLVAALQAIFPQATVVEGDRAGGVAAGLAWHGASLDGHA